MFNRDLNKGSAELLKGRDREEEPGRNLNVHKRRGGNRKEVLLDGAWH